MVLALVGNFSVVSKSYIIFFITSQTENERLISNLGSPKEVPEREQVPDNKPLCRSKINGGNAPGCSLPAVAAAAEAAAASKNAFNRRRTTLNVRRCRDFAAAAAKRGGAQVYHDQRRLLQAPTTNSLRTLIIALQCFFCFFLLYF